MTHNGRNGGRIVKRLMDVALAAIVLLVASPILLLCVFMIAVTMGRPILFRQQRPGLGEVPFDLVKLRTMNPADSSQVWFRSDSARLTPLGRALRRTSLDELPTLFNVLKGDMSLVGPRPLLMEYLPKYTPQERRRHEVRPGITGLAQVSGRQRLPFSERIRLDVWYVDNWALRLDLKILVRTLCTFGRAVKSGQDVDDVDDIGLSPDRARKRTTGS